MAAGKHSSSEVTVTIADSGGVNRVITSGVLTIGGMKITSPLELATALGDSWDKNLPSGVQKVDPAKLTGFFDDTATTGTHVVLGTPDPTPQTAPRAFIMVFGNSKTFTGTVFVQDYAVLAVAGKITKFEATLVFTGSVAWT
jgi:hypothetical protein